MLVVDDDERVRELVMSYLASQGVPVMEASDGAAAISMLQRSNGRYRLVITDLNLPGADGFAVLHAARQANASCYVVIVTGYASLDSAILAVRVGAYDYLTKPFSLGQLDVILARIADRASIEMENRELVHTAARARCVRPARGVAGAGDCGEAAGACGARAAEHRPPERAGPDGQYGTRID